MVLVLNGVLQDECPMDTSALFMLHPVYRDYANQLLEIPTKTVSIKIVCEIPLLILFNGHLFSGCCNTKLERLKYLWLLIIDYTIAFSQLLVLVKRLPFTRNV